MTRRKLTFLCGLLITAGGLSPLLAQDAAVTSPPARVKDTAEKETPAKAGKATTFVRLRRDENKQPLALETAIVSYVPADKTREGLVVDLIGAIHVGEKGYYTALNKVFRSYDAVLYELIAPEGTRVPKGGRRGSGGSPVSALQLTMKRWLELEFQLERIDYTKKNLVHADMSPREFRESMKKKGESFTTMFFRMLGQSMAMQSKGNAPSNASLLFAFLSKDRALRLKQLMAEQFQDLDTQLNLIEGPNGSTIIGARNEKALEVLKREIKAGKKRVAIFYGAGHMPDMEKKLLDDFRLKPNKTRWLPAWWLVKVPPAIKKQTEDQPQPAATK